MDSSPDTLSGGEDHATVTLEDRTITRNGQFSIPDKELFGIKAGHKDLGIFEIQEIPFTKPIYVTEGGARSTVDAAVRKALDIEQGDSVDIELLRIIPQEGSEVE